MMSMTFQHSLDVFDPIDTHLKPSTQRVRSKSLGSAGHRQHSALKITPPRGRPVAVAAHSKKGKAGGGKGSWGRLSDDIWAAEQSMTSDLADEVDQGVVLVEKSWGITTSEMKEFIQPKLSEFFISGLVDDVAGPIRKIACSELNPHVVEFIVAEATERNNVERELASKLLFNMSVEGVFARADIEAGFDLVLLQLDDLRLDTPNAHDVVGKFVARAVSDEIIAPRFVNTRPGPHDSDVTTRAFAKARGLIMSPQGLERLTTVWGPSGSLSSVDDLRRQVTLLLEEYLIANDMREAETCVRELNAKHFLHEVVFQATQLAIDGRSERDMLALSTLLRELCSTSLISLGQLNKGLDRVIASMTDFQLDSPRAALNLDAFCRVSQSFLPKSFAAKASQLATSVMNKSRGGRVRSVTASM